MPTRSDSAITEFITPQLKDAEIVTNAYTRFNATVAKSLRALVGEPIIAGLCLRTGTLPLHATHVGTGSISEFALLAIVYVLRIFFPRKRNETENDLGYSGRIYCVRTKENFHFVASRDNGQPTKVLCQFPASTLSSCERTSPNSLDIRFTFDSGESYALYSNGSKSDFETLGAFTETARESRSSSNTNG